MIDEAGTSLGVLRTADALRLADERGVDLVEMNPAARPPVCRLLDYGQYKYQQQKRERESRKASSAQELKELRLSVKIGAADLATKARHAAEWLDEGDRVRVSVRFRGREITHADLGRALLDRVFEAVADHGAPERPPVLEGRFLAAVLVPRKRAA